MYQNLCCAAVELTGRSDVPRLHRGQSSGQIKAIGHAKDRKRLEILAKLGVDRARANGRYAKVLHLEIATRYILHLCNLIGIAIVQN